MSTTAVFGVGTSNIDDLCDRFVRRLRRNVVGECISYVVGPRNRRITVELSLAFRFSRRITTFASFGLAQKRNFERKKQMKFHRGNVQRKTTLYFYSIVILFITRVRHVMLSSFVLRHAQVFSRTVNSR